MNLNKLIEIFKDLEVSTKNIREFLKSDDYFANYSRYQELTEIVKSTNYGLLEIDGRLAELNLTFEEGCCRRIIGTGWNEEESSL